MKMIKSIIRFYLDGFKEMSLTSRRLWLILLIKLAVMFLVLKLFFFQGYLSSRFETEQEKANYIHYQLTHKINNHE